MIESRQAYASPEPTPDYDASAQIGDVHIDNAGIDRLEVVRARYALELFRTRLGNDRVRELLKPDFDAGMKRAAEWLAASQGKWRPAITYLDVSGIGAKDFVEWFVGRAKEKDDVGMRVAHPEHFLNHPRDDGLVEVIETVGQDQGPWRIFLKFLKDASDVPVEPAPDYPIKLAVNIVDDAGTIVSHGLHEFRDTAKGFQTKLTLNFPSAVPEGIISGHQHHFAIEFRNWSRNASAAKYAKRSEAIDE